CGREEQPAAVDGIVPIAVDEDVTARRPDVIRGYPRPVVPRCRPVTGAPGVAAVVPDPCSGDPRLVWRGSLDTGALVDRLGWLGQVLDLIRLGVGPIAADPLVPVVRAIPIPRNPLAAGGQRAPHAAHPQEVIAIVIPGPVSRDPGHVGARRFLIRRNFL